MSISCLRNDFQIFHPDSILLKILARDTTRSRDSRVKSFLFLYSHGVFTTDEKCCLFFTLPHVQHSFISTARSLEKEKLENMLVRQLCLQANRSVEKLRTLASILFDGTAIGFWTDENRLKTHSKHPMLDLFLTCVSILWMAKHVNAVKEIRPSDTYHEWNRIK